MPCILTFCGDFKGRDYEQVLITALITGTSGYLLGIRTNRNVSQSTQRVSFQPSPTITAQSAVPTPSPVPITAVWKTYTYQPLDVSFQYPTNIKPGLSGNIVTGFNNYVQINYGLGYIFRITKFVTKQLLSDWLKQNSDNLNLSPIVTQTTFHGYPALSMKQTPETIQDFQLPVNLYIVKVSPTTLYEIQYAIPDPRYPQDTQENGLLTAGMQKMLDSITFLTDQ